MLAGLMPAEICAVGPFKFFEGGAFDMVSVCREPGSAARLCS